MTWLPDGKKLLLCVYPLLTQYGRVTNGPTDRQTTCDSIFRAFSKMRVNAGEPTYVKEVNKKE